jgi:hypothetical protein
MEMAVRTTHPLRQSLPARDYPFGYGRFTKRIDVGSHVQKLDLLEIQMLATDMLAQRGMDVAEALSKERCLGLPGITRLSSLTDQERICLMLRILLMSRSGSLSTMRRRTSGSISSSATSIQQVPAQLWIGGTIGRRIGNGENRVRNDA